eukprot:TRINITY_DN1893_c3_g1_i1.p1 TRINITY_DN1893_c3_g1~~TRINITY_DN1893_c3_g1_i1.p1  ORF type:complete len:509 (-),score=49.27 TRINITY_DN1893_c3_g1_i1:1429-2955(-)
MIRIGIRLTDEIEFDTTHHNNDNTSTKRSKLELKFGNPLVRSDLERGILRLNKTFLSRYLPVNSFNHHDEEHWIQNLSPIFELCIQLLEEYPGIRVGSVLFFWLKRWAYSRKNTSNRLWYHYITNTLFQRLNTVDEYLDIDIHETGSSSSLSMSNFHKDETIDTNTTTEHSKLNDVNITSFNQEQLPFVKQIVDEFQNHNFSPQSSSPRYRIDSLLQLHDIPILGECHSMRCNEGYSGDYHQNQYNLKDYQSWFDYATREFSDLEFRLWLLDQTNRSFHFRLSNDSFMYVEHKTLLEKDDYLQSILDYSLFANHPLIRYSGIQRPTHQGWSLRLHLKYSALNLSTSSLTHQSREIHDVIQSMRIGMLFHDCGKLVDQLEGHHMLEGKNMWIQLKPSWVNNNLTKLVGWCIHNHDLIGRFIRGISCGTAYVSNDSKTSKPYKASVSPSKIISRLQILSNFDIPFSVALEIVVSLWKADVKSISKLNWLLQLVNPVQNIITIASLKTTET